MRERPPAAATISLLVASTFTPKFPYACRDIRLSARTPFYYAAVAAGTGNDVCHDRANTAHNAASPSILLPARLMPLRLQILR